MNRMDVAAPRPVRSLKRDGALAGSTTLLVCAASENWGRRDQGAPRLDSRRCGAESVRVRKIAGREHVHGFDSH